MVKTGNLFLRSLLAPPTPKRKAKSGPTPKLKLAALAASVAPLKSTPARVMAKAAGGKWLASHHAGSSDGNPMHMRRLSYWLYLPDRPPAQMLAGPGLPLIVMLHGCDQSATSFAEGTRMNQPGNRRRHGDQLRDVYRGRKVMLPVARIAELKHAWSGGDVSVAFNSGRGPEAGKMMLDFFSRHRRSA